MKKLANHEKRSDKTKKIHHRRRTVHGSMHTSMEPEGSDGFTDKTPLNTTRHTRRPLQVVSASNASSSSFFCASEPQTGRKMRRMRIPDTKSIESLVKSKSKLSFMSRKSGSISPEENVNNSVEVDCHASVQRKKSFEESSGHSLVSSRKSGKLDFVVKDPKTSGTLEPKEAKLKALPAETKPVNTPKSNDKSLSNSIVNKIQKSIKSKEAISGSSKHNSNDCIQNVSCMNKMIDTCISATNKDTCTSYSASTCDSISDDELSNSIFDINPKLPTTADTEPLQTPKDRTATKTESSKLKTSRKSVSVSMRKALQEARISALKSVVKDCTEIEQELQSHETAKTVSSSKHVNEMAGQKLSESKSDKSPISLTPEQEGESQFKLPKSQDSKDWMHFFEDPFPRRSPRLSSLPRQDLREYEDLNDNFSTVTSPENVKRSRRSRSKGTSKTRSKGTPQTTTKNVTDSQKMAETTDNTGSDIVIKEVMTDDADAMTCSAKKTQERVYVHNSKTTKEQKQAKVSLKRSQQSSSSSICKKKKKKKKDINEEKDDNEDDLLREDFSGSQEEIHFPKPSPVLSRPGGPYTVVADFCLPDKDFVKLKLAKIKEAQAKKVNKMDSGGAVAKQNSSTLKLKAKPAADELNKKDNKTCLNLENSKKCSQESTENMKTSEKQKQTQDTVGNVRKSDTSEAMMQNSDSQNCLSGSILVTLWANRGVHSLCEENQSLGDDKIESECRTSSVCNNMDKCTKDANRNIENSVHLEADFYSKCPHQANFADKTSELRNMRSSPCSPTNSSPSLLQVPKYNDCVRFPQGTTENEVSENSPSGGTTKVVPSSQGSQSQSPNQTFLKGLMNCIVHNPNTDKATMDLTNSPIVSHVHREHQNHDSPGTTSDKSKRISDIRVTDGNEVTLNEKTPISEDTVVKHVKSTKVDVVSGSESTNDSEGFVIAGCSTNNDFNGGIVTNGCGMANQTGFPLQQSNATNARTKDRGNVLTTGLNDVIQLISLAQNIGAMEQGTQSPTQNTHCSNEGDTPFKEVLPVNTHTSGSANAPNVGSKTGQPSSEVANFERLSSTNTEELPDSENCASDSFPLCSNTEEFCAKSPQSVHLSLGNSPSIQHVSDAKPLGSQVTGGMLPVREGKINLLDGHNYTASLSHVDDPIPGTKGQHSSKHSHDSPAREHPINTSIPDNTYEEDHTIIGCQPMEPTNSVMVTPCGKGNSTPDVGYSVESQATEPSIGDTATPSGKANTPRSTSAAALPSDENVVLKPILMQACLQHENSECNTVQSISMSTYNVPGYASKKREVIAVCLPQWIVVWIKIPGEEWTILQTWALEFADSEMFQKVEFLPSASHLVVVAGGTFLSANGRIYGCSENMCYDFQLEYDDLDIEVSFNSLCVLSNKDGLNDATEQDIELIIAGTSITGPLVTKWTLDSLCLNFKNHSALPLPSDCTITSLSTVEGSKYLLIGLSLSNLILWNHQSCCLVKVIPITHLGLHSTDYLHAETHMGLLFLIICQRTTQKNDGFPCYLYALNPKNNRFKCLSSFSSNSALQSCVQCCSGSGQYLALGYNNGSVCLWNMYMGAPQTMVTFPAFQGAVQSISFHPTRPIVAFGGGSNGCIHLYSLS